MPQLLTHLTFGEIFNKPVDNLPQILTHLNLGLSFNHPINLLPELLTHLNVGQKFNHPINLLPKSLTHLTLGEKFNQPINITFNIKHLYLHTNNQNVLDNLPDYIEELNFSCDFDLDLVKNVKLNNLPNSIKKIIFNKYSKFNGELNCLPKFVESIQLPKLYDKKIINLPVKLKKIICHENYKYAKDYGNLNIEIYEDSSNDKIFTKSDFTHCMFDSVKINQQLIDYITNL